jgi:hypothetical protein
MNGEGNGLKVALEFEPCFLDEPFVFRIMGDRGQWVRAHPADPAEIGVEKSVGAGQQARGLRRGVLP